MSVNIELKSQETISLTTLFLCILPNLLLFTHQSLSLSAFLCLLVHKGFAQMTKTYVLLPVSGMKINIKQFLISSFSILYLYFIPVANAN